MAVLISLLLIMAIALLIAGLATGSTTFVLACFVVSMLTFLVMRRARYARDENAAASGAAAETPPPVTVDPNAVDAEAERPMWKTTTPAVRAEARIDPGSLGAATPSQLSTVEAGPADAAPATIAGAVAEVEPVPAPAVEPELRVDEAPALDDEDAWEPDPEDEPIMAYTVPPLLTHGSGVVWVVDGRPRYHVDSCTFLARQPEPIAIALLQAVQDGFTPCSVCNPDIALVAASA